METIVIANPIFDVVFKMLMEDKPIAKFFIETLIEETVVEVEVKPQEYTFYHNNDLMNDPKSNKTKENDARGRLIIGLFRLDFIATIKTETGEHKKVLIEIQKSKNVVDIMRFRNYLGEQYKKQDEIETPRGKVKAALPIIAIYLLGYELADLPFAYLKTYHGYLNGETKEQVKAKSHFVEHLTHDLIVVQLTRIKGKNKTRLDRLLSVFSQEYFIDDAGIVKEYQPTEGSEPAIKKMITLLHKAGTNPQQRKQIENEQEFLRTFDNAMEEMHGEKLREKDMEIEEKDKELKETKNVVQEKDRKLEEKDKALEENKKALEEKDRALEEKDKLIAALLRQQGNQ